MQSCCENTRKRKPLQKRITTEIIKTKGEMETREEWKSDESAQTKQKKVA